MMIDTTKESICVNQLVEQKNENRIIEGDLIVPDIKPDILKIIRSNGTICIYKKEVLDGKAKIEGTVQLHIIYVADDETTSVRSLNTSIDFSEIIQMTDANIDTSLNLKTCINSIEIKILNGRKINIKCNANLVLKLYSNESIDIIKSIDGINDIQELCHNIEVNSLIGQGCSKAYAKETVPLDSTDGLAEILDVEISTINKDIKISYNKVLVKADACVKILYLTENNDIKLCQTVIPAMAFVDIQDINEEHTCDVDFELKNLLIKANAEDECSVYVEVEFEVCCFAYERKIISVIEDLYSPTFNLNITQKNIKLVGNKYKKTDVCMIRERVPAQELVGNKIYNITINPVILTQDTLENRIDYNGELHISVLYYNETNGFINSKEFIIPIKFLSQIDGLGKMSEIDTQLNLQRQDFEITPDGSIEFRIDLEFVINAYDIKNISVIDEIISDEDKRKEDCSMVIYFAKSGDTLWKIAKRFGSTIEEIAKINEIENPDILEIGRQLYIPRYCKRQTA